MVHSAFNGTVPSQDVAMRLVEQILAEVGWGVQQVPGETFVSGFDPESAVNVSSEVGFQLLHGVMAVGR